MKTSIFHTPTPEEHWNDLKTRIVQEITDINASCPTMIFAPTNVPSWWIEMNVAALIIKGMPMLGDRNR